MHQLGFLDFATRLNRIDKAGDPLAKLNKTIDWEVFRPILERAGKKEKKSPAGVKGYDVILLFKALIRHRLVSCLAGILLALGLFACSRQPTLPPLAADAVILAFGDSLTFGTGAGEQESYPAVLAGRIGRTVVNAGVPGEVSGDGLRRLPGLLEQERPSLLILCHGGNDMLRRQDREQLRGNIRKMIELARQEGVAVLLVAVPEPGFSLQPPALYEELAREFALPFDRKTVAAVLKKGELKSDQVHPNAAGYRYMAEAFAELLRKSGALP